MENGKEVGTSESQCGPSARRCLSDSGEEPGLLFALDPKVNRKLLGDSNNGMVYPTLTCPEKWGTEQTKVEVFSNYRVSLQREIFI